MRYNLSFFENAVRRHTYLCGTIISVSKTNSLVFSVFSRAPLKELSLRFLVQKDCSITDMIFLYLAKNKAKNMVNFFYLDKRGFIHILK